MKTILLLVYPFLFCSFIYAQSNMPIQWQGCYGGNDVDIAADMVETDNGYLIIGTARSNDGDISNNHGSDDIWVISIDSIGNLLWERAYGGNTYDFGKRIVSGGNGYYYFVAEVGSNDGDIQSGNHGDYDTWVVKIDGTGEIIWERCYGGAGREEYPNIKLLSDGNLLVTSNSASSDGDLPAHYGVFDSWLLKISPDGEILQNEVFGNSMINYIVDIVETGDGGYFFLSGTSLVEGMVEGTYHGGVADVWAVKLDSNMDIEWQGLYGGSETDYGTGGLHELSDGYIFLAKTDSNDGDVSGFHGGYEDIWAVRIDLEGNIIWQRCLGGSGSESAGELQQTEDGGFIVFGITSSNNGDVSGNHSDPNGYTDIWMVKLSNSGELEWQQCYGGLTNEKVLSGVIKKSDYDWVVAGSAGSLYSGDVNCEMHIAEDFWVFEIKDTTTGLNGIPATMGALKVYPNPARDYVVFELPIALNNNNKSAVIPTEGRNPPKDLNPAGKSQGNRSGRNSKGVPHASPKSQAQGFGMTTPDETTVVIVNVYGQQVAELPVKAEKTVWDVRQTKNGVYFYNVEIEGKVLSGKIVIQE